MDPISQGALGAAFSQFSSDEAQHKLRAAGLLGCLAAMAPDLDVFIQSPTDPLLFLEFHRHFTHSLVFIPFGAMIVCALLYYWFRHRLSWREAYLAALVGYATHGLLDACTSYGTQLFWPFSNVRIAWNNVSVVDPLFTIPLLMLVITSAVRRQRRIAFVGIAWALTYLGFGLVQHERAVTAAKQVIASRGHEPDRLTVKPGFANLFVWKSIYQHKGVYHVDGIRVGGGYSWCGGKSVAKLDIAKHFPELDLNSQQAADIERFRWFSDDYLAPFGPPGAIIDVRYAALPNDINPMWSIQLDPTASTTTHADFVPSRRADSSQVNTLWDLIMGRACEPINVN